MKIKAWRFGVRDGIDSPNALEFGMTYERDEDANEWYDRGVNVGQALVGVSQSIRALAHALIFGRER
jgi:hypothetical protein